MGPSAAAGKGVEGYVACGAAWLVSYEDQAPPLGLVDEPNSRRLAVATSLCSSIIPCTSRNRVHSQHSVVLAQTASMSCGVT